MRKKKTPTPPLELPPVEEKKQRYFDENKKNRDEYFRMLEKVSIPNFNKVALEKYLPFTRVYLCQLLSGARVFKDEDLKKITKALMKYRADSLKGMYK